MEPTLRTRSCPALGPQVDCEMAPGTIIVLNGASSSGKTSIAKALPEALNEPYLHIGLDAFFDMVPGRGASI